MYFRTSYHYNKEALRDGIVAIYYCDTTVNVSDAQTKGLSPIKTEAFEPYLTGHKPIVIPHHN